MSFEPRLELLSADGWLMDGIRITRGTRTVLAAISEENTVNMLRGDVCFPRSCWKLCITFEHCQIFCVRGRTILHLLLLYFVFWKLAPLRILRPG